MNKLKVRKKNTDLPCQTSQWLTKRLSERPEKKEEKKCLTGYSKRGSSPDTVTTTTKNKEKQNMFIY